MDEFPGLLVRDSGFRSQGKSSPMAASTSIPSSKERSGWNSDSLLGDHEGFFENKNAQNYDEVFGIPYTSPHPASKNLQDYDDVFGGPPKSVSSSSPSLGFDSIFQGLNGSAAKPSSIPVYDKPVYDDDIFDGVPGIKSSSSVNYDDVFTSISSASNRASPPLDDLLGGFGRMEPESKGSVEKRPRGSKEQDLSAFDDLIPGFGGSSPKQEREPPEINHQQSATPSAKPTVSMAEDPFVVLETTSTSAYSSSGFVDPLEHISRSMNSRSTKIDASSGSGRAFDDIDAFDGISKSVPLYMSDLKNDRKNSSPLRTVNNMSSGHPPAGIERSQKSSMENFENILPKMEPVDNYRESQQTHFEKPIKSYDSLKSAGRSGVQSSDANVNPYENNATSGLPPKSNKHIETVDDVWLTVAEVPLFTQPTSASPPSRPPPPFVIKQAPGEKTDRGASGSLNANRKDEEFSFPESSQTYQFPDLVNDFGKVSSVSPIDELEDFAMAKPQTYPNERSEFLPNEEETETNSSAAASAAAIKEAMDEAEVKFKHAREVRERERDAKSVRSRDPEQQERDEKVIPDAQDREDTEKEERLDRERQQEREEKEKERKRLDEERQTELERERTRQVMGEARGRVAAEAHLKAEKAAVEKANAQARERDRAAYLRALAEARGRAAAEAKERAEKAEAKERAEKADAEAKEKADLEAKEKAAAESREKAAAEAREKAAAEAQEKEKRERTNLLRAQRAAVERATAEFRERATAALKEKQHKNENDLESIFGMGAQANSTRKQRATTSETGFDPQVRNKVGSEGVRRTSASCSSTDREASSTTNIVDDLASIFGDSPSSGEFPEVDGESEERRRARLERHQRVHQRTVKALADKNERESQTQKEQEERHRIAETLDIEIKRWAAGKEGNLRALLSTLQYVLWPECGWQPVSLIDLITPISVKKVYRKATLCIHPDKVQQKGANLQQKYIAEKVFDLLKEAWNKLNSEEFF